MSSETVWFAVSVEDPSSFVGLIFFRMYLVWSRAREERGGRDRREEGEIGERMAREWRGGQQMREEGEWREDGKRGERRARERERERE